MLSVTVHGLLLAVEKDGSEKRRRGRIILGKGAKSCVKGHSE